MVADALPDSAALGAPLDNPRRETFARCMARGDMTLAQCWREAGYSDSYGEKIQTNNAYKLSYAPEVRQRIAEIKAMAAHKDALTMQERRLALAAIVRTPATRFLGVQWSDPAEVQKLGPAVQAIKGIKCKSYENDSGVSVTEADLDMYDKIAAIREDAILAGERRTDGTQLTIGGDLNIAVVLQSLRSGAGLTERPAEIMEIARDGEMASRLPHKQEIAGSNPVPAPISSTTAVYGPLGPIRTNTRPAGQMAAETPQSAAVEVWEDE